MSRRHAPRTLEEAIEAYTDPAPRDGDEAREQLLQWDDEFARIALDVCGIVFRQQGARLYAVHRDQLLRDDLEDWLIIRAVEFGNGWVYFSTDRDIYGNWRGSLYNALTKAARWHFQDAVGRREEDITAYRNGIDSTDRLTEAIGDSWVTDRHTLHGQALNVDPLNVILRLEDLHHDIQRAEEHLRRVGAWTTASDVCLHVGCDNPHHARGWCMNHYEQEQRRWGNAGKPCSVPDCNKPHRTRGVCSMHYERYHRGVLAPELQQYIQPARERVNGDCTADGCDRPAKVKQLCGAHYEARRRMKPTPPCTEDGCQKPQQARGLCPMHYQRERARRKREGARPASTPGGAE